MLLDSKVAVVYGAGGSIGREVGEGSRRRARVSFCAGGRGRRSSRDTGTPMARRRQLRAGLTAAAFVLLTAACADDEPDARSSRSSTTSSSSSSSSSVLDGTGPCRLDAAVDVQFPAGRGTGQLHGVLDGAGDLGVVLAHESGQDACNWAFFVQEMAASGRQVLAFDFNGDGSSDDIGDGRLDLDVLAAVRELRARGASRVVVIGASKGATAAVAAAATPESGIDGVVSLSAVLAYAEVDAARAVPSLSVPSLFVGAVLDASRDEIAQSFADSCACESRALILDGGLHGINLLIAGPHQDEVRAAIEDLIAEIGT